MDLLGLKKFKMELDEPITYIIWIVFFLIAGAGVYFLLKSIGII